MAPSTSLHVTFFIPLKKLVTNPARFFNESNNALYSFWKLALVDYCTLCNGGLHIKSTIIWPMEFEHKLILLILTNCAVTSGLKL